MKWRKLGLVHAAPKTEWWSHLYAMMPTPVYLKEKGVIRIFYGTTDKERYGRAAFVDVDCQYPTKVVNTSGSYILDLGTAGTFDDCGAIPSSIVDRPGIQLLYYVGFQRVQRVPYMLFSGLATSTDWTQFTRYSQAPVIDRSKSNVFSHAAPFVLYDNDDRLFKMWYWKGNEWVSVNQKLYLSADISYATSVDGFNWTLENIICIRPDQEIEFSVGRPWVIKESGLYRMYYSVRNIDKLYRLGYAESTDGKVWNRKDNLIGIDVSESGWDSEMICYPAVITVMGKTYLFYNGNNNGETGFGVAELIEP